MLRPASRAYVTVLFLGVLLAFGLSLGALLHINSRVGHDERASCLIQVGSLPVAHELAAVMTDFSSLFAQETPAAVRKLPRSEQVLIANFERDLSAYLKLEAKQPQTRRC